MTPNTVVSREEWIKARKAHLEKERALMHQRDALYAERRALPWEKVEKDYVFQSSAGPKSLADLFDGRSQLFVYHFMLTPGSDHLCPGCSFLSDHIDGARQHFEHADLSFAAISRAPLARIEDVKKRMGWRFEWVSSGGTSFNYDYGVSFTPEQIAAAEPLYNYGITADLGDDIHGSSIFAMGDDGQIYHTYSTYARGDEMLAGAFAFLDMTPKGRNEEGETMRWVKLHDEYEDTPMEAGACCATAA
ncbi:DUF899 domain-containing protein [Sphingomonas cavernae]|uniref:DUF899 domain-containing protein n=1 Tax=Sphingomonas cavernae TaxID=2320861 RepID=A0A418WS41_9SPHN|nr:thioredoxin family protein [Sphingomonas cavernae]RJF94072.1 DUF899 domain-containing protein [Sphingomonas cavernae]